MSNINLKYNKLVAKVTGLQSLASNDIATQEYLEIVSFKPKLLTYFFKATRKLS